ncbi:hypothetical protein GCM10010385_57480 [Streptomyces geysiriensis]|uniref:hypothetical protein n=1 Tax=Streptomyces TaxID=1883 RepID=UPI000FAB5126|nr:hypothetical protein [Streptomyces sp. WAC06128]RSS71982.1 hypothetical protein EF911_26350 [Streptomyces sp. WAC06128]GGZ00377.1 hypothetical protein GCM10010385_57480 [Streptomyces geysiriensis]
MSESTTQPATQLASQYSVQVTDDLERNVKEQERVSAEIAALQQQLAGLQHDHALLVNMQQALGITPPSAAQDAADTAAGTDTATAPDTADAASVPAPRDGAATEPAVKRTRGRKSAAAPRRAAAPKPGAKPASKSTARSRSAAKPAPGQAAKTPAGQGAKSSARTGGKRAAKKPSAKGSSAEQATAQPTLVELVRAHLAEQSEPRSAAEVATALGRANTGRSIKTTVVRTTLEGLVARNQAQRTKQGTSVYYTAADAPRAAEQQDPGAEAAPAEKKD